MWRKNPVESVTATMARSMDRNMLSVGVFLIIFVVALLLGAFAFVDWGLVPPMIIFLCGCWVLVMAGMQTSTPQKYGYSSFTLFAWGLILIAVGGAWLLYAFSYNYLYSLALILLVVGALAIVAAIRKK